MASIYKIKCKDSDDFYIGSTKNLLSKRMAMHRYNAKRGLNCKLYKYMREIGVEKFEIEKIHECDEENRKSVEEVFRILMKPKLNLRCAYTGIPKDNYDKHYYKANADKIKQRRRERYKQQKSLKLIPIPENTHQNSDDSDDPDQP